MTGGPFLAVRDLAYTHPDSALPAVDGVSFDVREGEIYALLGPSGAGKTTVLRLLAGFEDVHAGSIVLRSGTISEPGRTVPPEKRGIGFVFQEFALFPHLSVEENVCFGVRNGRTADADNLLARMQIERLASRMPGRLSGGEQQRVALARSLAPKPSLLLLDEPFSSLDADLRGVIRGEVRRYLKQHGIATIIVTHDQEEALAFADRVAVMRDGKIVQEGRAEELYQNPATAYVANFLGGCNLLEGVASGDTARTAIGEVALTSDASGRVRIAIRPEHLTLGEPGEAGEPVVARIVTRDFHGHDITFRVAVGEIELLVKSDYGAPWKEGDAVRVAVREKGVVVE